MKYMQEAINSAYLGIENNEGGPFGCCIVDKNNNIIAISHNKVLKNSDPTAHAEVEAIRLAGKKLNSHDLSGCKLYTTCEPCPMCLFAIMWANIDEVYYGCDRKDAANIGFRDEKFYDYLKGDYNIKLISIDKTECLKLFESYKKNSKTIY